MTELLVSLGIAVLLVLVVLAVTLLAARARSRAIRESPEMAALRDRLSRGEIDEAEFERRRRELESR